MSADDRMSADGQMDAAGPMSAPAFPAYGIATPVTPFASLLVQHNPGLMTLEGTNTWLLRDPTASGCIVVDPGQGVGPSEDVPELPAVRPEEHLDALLEACGTVDLVLVSHRHEDHVGLAAAVHEATGAPVRALDPSLCRGAAALADGEVLSASGVDLAVLATPGHSSDSTSFVLRDASGSPAAVLTGDMILGHGTTVVAHPDGVLGPYLDSIAALGELGPLTVLPGHGPVLPSLAEVAGYYLTHRQQRLAQVRDVLGVLGADADARAVVEHVYADVDEALWDAAELSVRAQLAYLRD